MIQNLKDITRRIVDGYQPDRIILYGSNVDGKTRKGSDIDLLVIKDSHKRPVERRMEVERLLTDRLVPIDIIVYTPDETRRLFALGSPFIEEVLEKGRVLYMRKATENWVMDARDELDSGVILYEHGKHRSACYHSQQCIEKGLKALILEKGQRPERIHDIIELLNKVRVLGWEIPLAMDDAVFLNSIYKGRYPTEEGLLPHGEPTREDAEKTVSTARVFMERIESLLKDSSLDEGG